MTASKPGSIGVEHPLSRLAYEVLERFVTRDAAESLLRDAAAAAGETELPSDPARMAAFVTGSLYETVSQRVGRQEADAVLLDLAPLVERASSQMRSGVRRVQVEQEDTPAERKRVMLVATGDREAVARLDQGGAAFLVRGVDDVFGLIHGIEAFQDHQITVVVDGQLPTLQKSTIAMLARVLPPTATVVLWGVHGAEELLRADGWHYLPRSESELQLVRAALGEDAHHARTLPPPLKDGARPADIVVADDDSSFRASLARLLRSRGHQVRTAPDGYSALNLCMQRRPDLIITDRDMPSVDGAQLARLIKDMLGDVAPPIILVSSLPGDHVPEAEVIMSKHEARNDLLPTVARILEQRRPPQGNG